MKTTQSHFDIVTKDKNILVAFQVIVDIFLISILHKKLTSDNIFN